MDPPPALVLGIPGRSHPAQHHSLQLRLQATIIIIIIITITITIIKTIIIIITWTRSCTPGVWRRTDTLDCRGLPAATPRPPPPATPAPCWLEARGCSHCGWCMLARSCSHSIWMSLEAVSIWTDVSRGCIHNPYPLEALTVVHGRIEAVYPQ